jgi:hypothetical protein
MDSLPQLQRDTKFEGFTWFNQVDVNLNAQQSMTATFTLYPQKLNYLGLAERQLIEVPMLVGQYHIVSFTLNTLGIQREPGLGGFDNKRQ